jgi:hypothetical protein
VDQHSRAFIGIDTSKLRNAVAVAEDRRDGDVRYFGEMDTTEAATRKLVIKLAAKYRRGWAHGIRAPWVDREAWPQLLCGGTLAHAEETWRSGEDEPTRRGGPSQAIARRGTHHSLVRRAA